MPAVSRTRAATPMLGRATEDAEDTEKNSGSVNLCLLCRGESSFMGRAFVTEKNSMSDDELKSEVDRLRAENERLKNRQTRGVSLKVSEKGGVSVYGLGRFPVTLYKEQWTRLLDMADDIRAFIKENDAKLKTKPE